MNPVRTLLGAVEGLVDRALCVIGAVIFSQMPEFMQQYLQRLGGHLDEARRQLQQFQQTAAQSGLTLDHLIAQTSTDANPAVAKLGGVMTATVARVDALQTAQAAIQHASLWNRPFVFLRYLDPAIAHATWTIFKPAVPTTIEGFVYALTGMLVLIGTYHLGVKYPIRRVARRRRAEHSTSNIQRSKSNASR
ncbi:MAG TPA: DUF2937 family protein [Opitutaceae bacterium]|nr:DUF2937 family protein [Opitutaceae bacterium]